MIVHAHMLAAMNCPMFQAARRPVRASVIGLGMLLSCAMALQAADPVPVASWDFGAEETTPLVPHGSLHRDLPGPRPPEYPDFAPDNNAVKLDGRGAYLSFEDSGPQSPFDFTSGDAITLEAFVRVDELNSGENAYVISKGRTGSKGFAPDNQNWALRVRESGGNACVSFLFATPRTKDQPKGDSHWHRWTTRTGFRPSKYWHHIAVTYRFGEPESIRGWIDGKPVAGAWDMGGPTADAPVVDDDAIWIGSALGGSPSNSFRGMLDSIAIYRDLVNDDLMKTRFSRVGEEVVVGPAPEVMPEITDLAAGEIRLSLHEGMPAHNRWLNTDETLPAETLRWQTNAFLMDRFPQQYDSWGIRDDWKAPVLVRFAADIELPAGEQRFLMRTRGLSRLWVNGEVIARSKSLTGSPSGEEPITPVTEPLLSGMRIAEHRQQEVTGVATISSAGPVRVILETLVGGKSFRTDPGELCVAIESPDGQSYHLVQSGKNREFALIDSDVTQALTEQEYALRAFDDQRRRLAATSQDEFWSRRHDAARKWAAEQPAVVPPVRGQHPIDAFLTAKIETAVAASAKTSLEEARKFHDTVLPILRDNCFRCHGDKMRGGLLLNSREAALKGGESESPAVVPGDVEQSELILRVRSKDDIDRMPPAGNGLKPEEIATLEAWIRDGARWPAIPVTPDEVAASPLTDDEAFLRRVYLDTIGIGPNEKEAREFLADASPDKRERLIDRLLSDDRWADHWVSYWQDVLAENPTLINASLNTTGPFRWYLYEALLDGKPLDRLVTELILLRGSRHEGGSAGFGIAANNDAPFAAKGQIVASAFLGIELQCARCHDSPYHSTKQSDLYSLAAMFEQKPVTVPATSRVPDAFFAKQGRTSLIKVTLKPNEPVTPDWPFEEVTGCADDDSLSALIQDPKSSRQRLAALITAPQNERFAQVTVNRLWRRLVGAGLVEPPEDWEGHAPSHPDLLKWLAREFVSHDYNLKHVIRLIMTSEMYQREAVGKNRSAAPELRFFAAPDRRRLTGEQIVDSLHASAGQAMDAEELTFDPDGRRASSNRLTLGVPERAWMFANLANERDRPSLGLPRARAITDIMEAFGWTGARQNPRTDRETDPNVLQPGVLANSAASVLLTRASMNSGLADIAVKAQSPSELVDSLFLRYLGRMPSEIERVQLVAILSEGFDQRLVPEQELQAPKPLEPLPGVTWSNHLRPEANSIALELEKRARDGSPPDPRLRPQWREVYEDVVWSIVNLGEFVWVP